MKAFIADQKRKHGLTGTDTIFHKWSGKPMVNRSVYRIVKTLVKRTGLNK
jgi:hypothetical protein